MKSIDIQSIGIIHSPFSSREEMPIQPVGAQDVEGEIHIDEPFGPGLKDLEGFSHIYLIYHFHRTRNTRLQVIPFMDTVMRGVFSTRSPRRPSRIGMSVVELIAVEGNVLRIRGVDILDGTPLLDIKPYVPAFDDRANARTGWLTADMAAIRKKRSDNRFS